MDVVVSGKGGVGKTNLALNLGIQLARRGLAVILVDADLGLANADILLNLAPLADLSDLLDETRVVEQLLVSGPAGLRVLCGVTGATHPGGADIRDHRRCAAALARLRPLCDVIIVDCAAGVTPAVSSFALAADRLLLTTTPEPTALADVYATLKVLFNQGFTGEVGAVVNMVSTRGEASAAIRRLQRVAAQFLGLTVLDFGYVPRDRHVLAAVRARVPVVVSFPRCSASACIEKVSRHLLPARPQGVRPNGLWARVANLFL
ncbi:MAG: P-loop NTPase [Planctomycetes bacterium]|nr:P-loop NTPase [Planctomycetota bacterium]